MEFGFIPIEGPEHFGEALEEVKYGEKLCFDSVFIQERHLIKRFFWPTPLLAASAFLAQTSRIRVGTDILILPLYHPARLAEEIAVLDITSGGRFIFGTAIGYKEDEFTLYNVPMERRGSRFEEGLVLMKKLWTESTVTFSGKYFSLQNIEFEPKPRTKPHPPVWIGGWRPLMLDRAARLGNAWLPGVSPNIHQVCELKQFFLRKRQEAGMPQPRDWPLTRDIIIAETKAEARALAERHLLPFYKNVYAGQWKHQFINAEITQDLDKLAKDRFIIGNPEEVTRGVKKFIDLYGATHFICRFFFGDMPHEVIMKELALFAREVIPRFTSGQNH